MEYKNNKRDGAKRGVKVGKLRNEEKDLKYIILKVERVHVNSVSRVSFKIPCTNGLLEGLSTQGTSFFELFWSVIENRLLVLNNKHGISNRQLITYTFFTNL